MQTLYPDCFKRTGLISLGLMLTLATSPQALAGPLAQFRTVIGDIEVELFDDKPATTQNFIRYVQFGAYQNMFFHRCVPGFVVQGGGFATHNQNDTNPFYSYIPVATFSPITNEYSVGRRISNTYGTIAMAKQANNPDSATSQWFFNLADNGANLDNQNGGFTVFGRVVRGTNVLNYFNPLNKTLPNPNGIVDLRWWFPTDPAAALFSDLPVRYSGAAYPRYSDLFYVDVTLLNVQVRLASNGARAISWNSVSGRSNQVQFTTNLPPVWNLLTVTNGTGLPMQVLDTSTNAARRFYRVKVDF